MKLSSRYKRQLHKRMLIAGVTVVVMMASLFACLKPLFVSEKELSVVENSATDSISFINTGNGLGLSVTASNNTGVNSIEVYTGSTQIASYTYTDGKTVHSETISTTNTAAFGASKAYSLVVNGQTTVSTTLTNNRYISDAADLVSFRNSVNNGNNYSGKYVELTNDIDLSTVCSSSLGSWVPIGVDVNFLGTFNGNYHVIKNIYINSNTYANAGLFGENKGTIENIRMQNVSIYNGFTGAMARASGIAAFNAGTIMNAGVDSGTITGVNMTTTSGHKHVCTGGIVGWGETTCNILNCYNKANVDARVYNAKYSYNSYSISGGIIGYLSRCWK